MLAGRRASVRCGRLAPPRGRAVSPCRQGMLTSRTMSLGVRVFLRSGSRFSPHGLHSHRRKALRRLKGTSGGKSRGASEGALRTVQGSRRRSRMRLVGMSACGTKQTKSSDRCQVRFWPLADDRLAGSDASRVCSCRLHMREWSDAPPAGKRMLCHARMIASFDLTTAILFA